MMHYQPFIVKNILKQLFCTIFYCVRFVRNFFILNCVTPTRFCKYQIPHSPRIPHIPNHTLNSYYLYLFITSTKTTSSATILACSRNLHISIVELVSFTICSLRYFWIIVSAIAFASSSTSMAAAFNSKRLYL